MRDIYLRRRVNRGSAPIMFLTSSEAHMKCKVDVLGILPRPTFSPLHLVINQHHMSVKCPPAMIIQKLTLFCCEIGGKIPVSPSTRGDLHSTVESVLDSVRAGV